MEGNYRIVQLSDSAFVIEKEVKNVIKYPWYKFKKDLVVFKWVKVDAYGKTLNSSIFNKSEPYYFTTSLKVAKERLEQIKKYPLIIDYAKV